MISFFTYLAIQLLLISDGIKVDIESLSEEDRQKLIQQLVNEEDIAGADTGKVVEENSIQDILKIINQKVVTALVQQTKAQRIFRL